MKFKIKISIIWVICTFVAGVFFAFLGMMLFLFVLDVYQFKGDMVMFEKTQQALYYYLWGGFVVGLIVVGWFTDMLGFNKL